MSDMNDYLSFRKMLTPVIIQIIFWIGAVICVLGGIIGIVTSAVADNAIMILYSILTMLLGPLVVRIYCEILIVVFRINDNLVEMNKKLDIEEEVAE